MGLSPWTFFPSVQHNHFFKMLFLAYLIVPSLAAACAISPPKPTASPRALYFLDSRPAGAGVAALSINLDNGTLSGLTVNPTGQLGALGLQLNASNPTAPAAPSNADPLFSQDAIIVARDVSLLCLSKHLS
jgi:hypothetical protein